MSEKEDAKERAAFLAGLREQNADSVARTQVLVKEQNALRKQLRKALRKQLRKALKEGAKSIPELAAATGLPSDQVLWHVTAMKKYDLIVETGMDDSGEYYLYALPE